MREKYFSLYEINANEFVPPRKYSCKFMKFDIHESLTTKIHVFYVSLDIRIKRLESPEAARK